MLSLQELERQAMEQYGNNNTSDERHSIPSENQDCFDGQRCSGYGQCSPSRGRKDKCGGSKVVATSTKCMLEKERVSLILIFFNKYHY